MARFQSGDMGTGERGKDDESAEHNSIEGVPDCSEDACRDIIVAGCKANHGLEDIALEDFFRDILTAQVVGIGGPGGTIHLGSSSSGERAMRLSLMIAANLAVSLAERWSPGV